MALVFYLKECTSTQDESARLLLYENSEILATYTFNQTKGKGQYGNSWQSSVDKNIAYSLAIPVIKIKVPVKLLNFYTAIIVRDFLVNMSSFKVQIKWPNDLIINNKKVSGLLIEGQSIKNEAYFIFGIGLNVLQSEFPQIPKAGSIWTQTGIWFELDELAIKFHEYFSNRITNEISNEAILNQINQNLFRKDELSVFEIKGIRQNGIIKNVDEEGFLLVELEKGGLQRFFHKEIELLY